MTSGDPRVSLPARGAALILNAVSRMMDKRSDEEALAILHRLLAEGAKPVSQAELDAQVDEILEEFGVEG